MLNEDYLLLDSLPQAFFRLDQQGLITYANPAATQLTQYTQSELINHHISLLYNPAGDRIKADYELSQAHKFGLFSAQAWRQKKDQTRFWGELTLTVVKSDGNNIIGYCCQIRDSSVKNQQELDLRQREERYRLMVEGVRDYAIFMLDPTGHILTWNEGAKHIKGYFASEIIGKHFSTFYTAQDLADQKPTRELAIAIRTGKYEEEGWRVKKNGSVFWANIVITALFNEQNQHIGFSKVTRDLTERKETQESLYQSEQRYRSLVEQVADYGIFMMDEKGRIINWNEGAKRINGYTAEEIIGKYFSIFYPEEDIRQGKPANELQQALATGKYEEEGWRIRKDGSSFWANVVITALYNPQGINIGFSKVTRDLTERKQAEQALRDSHDRYRQLAAELQRSNEELSLANEELEQFTAVVSHDLQEPIRTIKSFLLLIHRQLSEENDDSLKNYIVKSLQAAHRMKELIQNLLHYSQLGKGEFTKENVAVNHLLDEVFQNLKSSLEASGAQLAVDLPVASVYGNRMQLIQLLQNLISNALKFIAQQPPSIHIRCTPANDHIQFSVADNGIGIAQEDQDKIFEVFQRLPTAQHYSGNGMGLAICKKIIERHGGRIWLESQPGQGTTFYFTLMQSPTKPLVV